MKYRVIFRFWGNRVNDVEVRIVDNAKMRDKLLKELRKDYAITYISYDKILSDGTIKPVCSEILH